MPIHTHGSPISSLMKAMYTSDAYELTNWNMKVFAIRLSSYSVSVRWFSYDDDQRWV